MTGPALETVIRNQRIQSPAAQARKSAPGEAYRAQLVAARDFRPRTEHLIRHEPPVESGVMGDEYAATERPADHGRDAFESRRRLDHRRVDSSQPADSIGNPAAWIHKGAVSAAYRTADYRHTGDFHHPVFTFRTGGLDIHNGEFEFRQEGRQRGEFLAFGRNRPDSTIINRHPVIGLQELIDKPRDQPLRSLAQLEHLARKVRRRYRSLPDEIDRPTD